MLFGANSFADVTILSGGVDPFSFAELGSNGSFVPPAGEPVEHGWFLNEIFEAFYGIIEYPIGGFRSNTCLNFGEFHITNSVHLVCGE